jgi:hypothetical protein
MTIQEIEIGDLILCPRPDGRLTFGRNDGDFSPTTLTVTGVEMLVQYLETWLKAEKDRHE